MVSIKLSFLFLSFILISSFPNEITSIPHHPAGIMIPNGASDLTPYYDGDDFIYLFGGMKAIFYPPQSNTNVYKFSISKGTTVIAGQTPPIEYYYPTMVLPSETNASQLYYLQTAFEDDTYAYKFDLTTGTSETLGKTDMKLGGSVPVKDSNGTTYLVGGLDLGTNIAQIDFESDQIQTAIVGNISQQYSEVQVGKIGNTAFLFGSPRYSNGLPYVTIDMETLTESPPLTNLWEFSPAPRVITTNRKDELLFMGGDMTANLTGIYQMNTTTQKTRFIHIEGFPEYVGDEEYPLTYFMYPRSTVYVEKVNRIYFFGGLTYFLAFLPNIWYIDLADIPLLIDE